MGHSKWQKLRDANASSAAQRKGKGNTGGSASRGIKKGAKERKNGKQTY
jgi:hypothetical protein